MKQVLMLKCGELVLKGLNRGSFEKKLLENASRMLDKFGQFDLHIKQSIVYAEPRSDFDLASAEAAAKRIFGVASVAKAVVCEKNMSDIKSTLIDTFNHRFALAKTFKVEARRSDKSFPLSSPQICADVGGFICDKFPNIRADMDSPDITVHVEIRDFNAFIHAGSERGAGGMPVGSNGKTALMLSGGIDSPVAGYMMARRGLAPIMVHFFSYPYTSEQAKDKVIDLAHILAEYIGNTTLLLVPFTKVQEQIRKNCSNDFFTVIMRRFMMRITAELAARYGCNSIVTGESLGQVASQTAEAIAVTEEVVSLPVLRPLVGMDKEDIVRIARKIGTFDVSVLPYEDCCTVFTPKHPIIKPRLEKVLANEQKLDIAALTDECVAAVEIMKIEC